jgi:hypothetical protein
VRAQKNLPIQPGLSASCTPTTTSSLFEHHDVDRELHAEHVDPLARHEPQAGAGLEAGAAEQPLVARLGGLGDLDVLGDDGITGEVAGADDVHRVKLPRGVPRNKQKRPALATRARRFGGEAVESSAARLATLVLAGAPAHHVRDEEHNTGENQDHRGLVHPFTTFPGSATTRGY